MIDPAPIVSKPSKQLLFPRRAVIAVLIVAVALGLFSAQSSIPAGAPTAGAARTDAAIPNLTAIKAAIVAYHDSGAWDADIYLVLRPATDYLLEQANTGDRTAIVFDIDDTLLSNYTTLKGNDFGRVIPELTVAIEQAAFGPIEGSLDLYNLAVANGVAVFLISGRGESLRESTERNLAAAGIATYAGLILRPADASTDPSVIPFKSGARRRIAEEGYRILINVGDQESDLAGGWAERTFKLPNPMYLIP